MGDKMGIFSKALKVGGMLGYFGLGEWWIGTFSEADRKLLAQLYRDAPILGGLGPDSLERSLDSRDTRNFMTTRRASQLLEELAVHADKSAPQLVPAILAKAEEVAAASSDPLDLHFVELLAIKLWYRRRDSTPGALDAAIVACERQIGIGPQAFAPLMAAFGMVPGHRGFQQLAIIREKQGDYAEAIRLCREAESQGWRDGNDDWSKRIARLEKCAARE
jgi:hypothetical protein